MKSIIQEESSVERAIKVGWEKAGKPREFSVKIFEEEKKNFIGMTKQPAKIALFFEEKKQPQPQPRKQAYRKRKPYVKTRTPQVRQQRKSISPRQHQDPESRPDSRSQQVPREQRKQRSPQDSRNQQGSREQRNQTKHGTKEQKDQRVQQGSREQRAPRNPRVPKKPQSYRNKQEPRDQEARETNYKK